MRNSKKRKVYSPVAAPHRRKKLPQKGRIFPPDGVIILLMIKKLRTLFNKIRYSIRAIWARGVAPKNPNRDWTRGLVPKHPNKREEPLWVTIVGGGVALAFLAALAYMDIDVAKALGLVIIILVAVSVFGFLALPSSLIKPFPLTIVAIIFSIFGVLVIFSLLIFLST